MSKYLKQTRKAWAVSGLRWIKRRAKKIGPDADGHCVRCGCPWEQDIAHECPPGFLGQAKKGGGQ